MEKEQLLANTTLEKYNGKESALFSEKLTLVHFEGKQGFNDERQIAIKIIMTFLVLMSIMTF